MFFIIDGEIIIEYLTKAQRKIHERAVCASGVALKSVFSRGFAASQQLFRVDRNEEKCRLYVGDGRINRALSFPVRVANVLKYIKKAPAEAGAQV